MRVYAGKAIYDDPWSYCDDRFKIAGQWYGIPMVMASTNTLATEIVKSSDDEIVFKLRQEYKPKLSPKAKIIDNMSCKFKAHQGRR
ncbi:e1ae4ed2-ce9c-4bca-83ca-dd4e87bf9a21 [Sclerotinia trifoliorum]|uniref:E1ae4ed2-ce9c-4bca-83ca-dd4e87bf9a21 n=1 Tax=Sclerotinia trifoliorum TaxID=28548 RepID=A0A8H2VN20_9HELO|nr:e1ae4ed2-ce9c-4bca-83ca-dd4e87bf9a21 [Sclerotinia trifoliorum]